MSEIFAMTEDHTHSYYYKSILVIGGLAVEIYSDDGVFVAGQLEKWLAAYGIEVPGTSRKGNISLVEHPIFPNVLILPLYLLRSSQQNQNRRKALFKTAMMMLVMAWLLTLLKKSAVTEGRFDTMPTKQAAETIIRAYAQWRKNHQSSPASLVTELAEYIDFMRVETQKPCAIAL